MTESDIWGYRSDAWSRLRFACDSGGGCRRSDLIGSCRCRTPRRGGCLSRGRCLSRRGGNRVLHQRGRGRFADLIRTIPASRSNQDTDDQQIRQSPPGPRPTFPSIHAVTSTSSQVSILVQVSPGRRPHRNSTHRLPPGAPGATSHEVRLGLWVSPRGAPVQRGFWRSIGGRPTHRQGLPGRPRSTRDRRPSRPRRRR